MLRQNMNRHKSIASSARRTGRQYDLAVTRQIAVLFLGLNLALSCSSQAVLGQDDLVAWWPFDDATVDHARDRAGKIDDRVIGHSCRINGAIGAKSGWILSNVCVIRQLWHGGFRDARVYGPLIPPSGS